MFLYVLYVSKYIQLTRTVTINHNNFRNYRQALKQYQTANLKKYENIYLSFSFFQMIGTIK